MNCISKLIKASHCMCAPALLVATHELAITAVEQAVIEHWQLRNTALYYTCSAQQYTIAVAVYCIGVHAIASA